MTLVHLKNDKISCRIAPEMGGAVYTLDYVDGAVRQNLLRPTWGESAHLITDYANWPLVPFSNRIRYGKFRFQGKEHRIPVNWMGLPHASHGHGWERPWRVTAQNTMHCTLSFAFDDPAIWPFPYAAEQKLSLLPNGLKHVLSLTNAGNQPMPAGLGLHPYFPKPPGTTLQTTVKHMWEVDETVLPVRRVAVTAENDFIKPKILDDTQFDHCFDGYHGFMQITWPGRPMKLNVASSPNLGHFVVYTPPGKDFFCAEPVSHMPDAINRMDEPEHGLIVLHPGETMTAEYKFETIPA